MVVFFLTLFGLVYGINFYLQEGYQKCFIIDAPQSQVILGKYNLIDTPPANRPEEGVDLEVIGPDLKQILTRKVRGAGKFSFTTQIAGRNKICVFTKASSWFRASKKVRFELKLDDSIESVNHEHVASKEQLGHLEEIVTSLNEKLDEIVKQQEYSREKEAMFKDESEDINSRIMYFTVFQTLIILFSGIWQIWSLRSFFLSRKLIS